MKQDRVITRSTTVRKRKDIEPKKARKSLSQTEQALRQRADELAALHALSVDIAAAMDFPTLLEKIVQRAAELLNATGGAIALCDEAKKEVLLAVEHSPASNIHPGVVFKYGEGATGRVAKTGKPLIIDDYRTWSGRAKVYEQSKPYTAVLSVPMIWQGKVVGVLQVMADTDKRRFTKADQELLSLFATQAAIAIENTRLYSQTATEQRHLSLLFELARELTASLEPVEILNRAISLTCHSLEGLIGQALLYQGDTEKLVLQAIYGRPEDWLDEPTHRIVLKPGQGLGGWVAKNRQPVYIPDVSKDKRWLFISGVDEDVQAAISAPILSGDRLLGVLSVMHVQTGAFSTSHLTLLQAICQEVGLALANAERYQQVQRQLAEITFIQNLAQTFNRRLQLQELLNEVVTQLAERLGYPLVEIFLIDRDSLLQRAAYGVTATSDRLLMSQGIIGRVARTGQVALVPDVSQDPDYLPSYASTVAELVVPIIHGSVVVGIINIETGTPGQLTTRDRELLEVLAGQISIALENAVLYEHLRTHIGDLEASISERTAELVELYELSQKIGYTLSHGELLQMLLSHLQNAVRSDLVVGGLFQNGQQLLYVETTRPIESACMRQLQDYWLGVMQEQGLPNTDFVAIPIQVVSAETFKARDEPLKRIGSLIYKPIGIAGDVVGILIAGCERENAFDEAQARTLETFANQATAALQRLAAMLAAEQKRLEGLVEHLPLGVLLLDADFRLLMANPLGKNILDELNTEADGRQITHLGSLALAELVAHQDDFLPLEIVKPGPIRRVFVARARPAGEDSRQWVLTLQEVTQERQYQARIQMQERLATVGQLAAGIAHDFNNIMAAILVYTDLLTDDPDIPWASRERLRIIEQQVQRAASLIRQILDFSRRSVMEQSDLDLLPFIKELDKMLRRVLPETILLELSYGTGNYVVRADPTRIQQAFMNLALNARDAMPNGGLLRFELGQIVVKPDERPPIAEMKPGEWVCITVKDNGIGIRTDQLPHIFEPFFTTKPVGHGTGLGLAQVYGIIKQHEGLIDVKSRVGHGTTFTIYLPVRSASQAEEQISDAPVQLDGVGKTVLVVEDDPATREALQALLEAHRYYVKTAKDGLEAVKLLEKDQKKIDLVVSDVVMPQMGGVALFHTIQDRWPSMKILLVTGHPLAGENQKMLEEGKITWLQKPFSAKSFNQTIFSLLNE